MMACFFLLVMSACYVEESGRVCCAVGSLCDSGLTKILNGDSFENDSRSNDFCVANHNQRPEPGRPYMVFFLEQQKTAT